MKLKIVVIEWIDTCYYDDLLINDNISNILKTIKSITIGFLIKETDEFVAIASSYIPIILETNMARSLEKIRPDLLHDQLRDVLTIPRSIIKQMMIIDEIETEEGDKIKKIEIKK